MTHQGPQARRRDRHYIDKVADDYLRMFPWLDRRALQIMLALSACFRSATVVFDDAAYAVGLGHTIGRLALLRVLYFAQDRHMSQAEIGKELQVTPSSVTSMVTGLERDGLVVRTANESDRRVIFVSLTPEGAEVSRQMLPLMPEVAEGLWQVFTTEEQQTLLDLLLKFLDELPDRDLRPGERHGTSSSSE